MYARRLQITNYGPIEQLDIEFPFDAEGCPKPVVLVGENGSGKTILLSHIVNGLIAAKDYVYDRSPEAGEGQVYKLRSSQYIKAGSDYYFARFDFGDGFFTSEIRLGTPKGNGMSPPQGINGTDAQALWDGMPQDSYDRYESGFRRIMPSTPLERILPVRNAINQNCVLYFPAHRFDEPAWLKPHSLTDRATISEPAILADGETTRRVIASAPLHAIRDWLFDIIFDQSAFEAKPTIKPLHNDSGKVHGLRPVLEHQGQTTAIHDLGLTLIRRISGLENAWFRIGNRRSRLVSLYVEDRPVVPNIFQLSSGEVSLLNLFFSILRDYDLCNVPFSEPQDVRGIVVVDEIDLHLHANHQCDVLPRLIQLFPKVQFVVTTHSPLFVLGMSNVLGEDGFDLRRLPDGERIGPEEFSEFGNAYQAFAATRRYADEARAARELIDNATKPLVFVEGKSDMEYISKAASLLNRADVLDSVRLEDGNGAGSLAKVWKDFSGSPLAGAIPQKVILLFDSDTDKGNDRRGKLFKRTIPPHPENPIKKGIENLFPETALAAAAEHDEALIDIAGEQTFREDGKNRVEPEIWSVSNQRKMALCKWLCENGTAEDFENFTGVFDILEEVLQSANHDDSMPH